MIYNEPEGLRWCVYESRDQSGCRSEEGTLWPIHTCISGEDCASDSGLPGLQEPASVRLCISLEQCPVATGKPVPGWEKSFT